ncbi:MAG: VWA domain-containing protein [Acidobacteriota bacterium]
MNKQPTNLQWNLLLAAFLVVAGSLSGQQPTAAQGTSAAESPGGEGAEEVFFETLDVNLVNLDVYVTDKAGNPVTDLTVEDFEVFEDGRRQKISNFSAVAGGRRLGSSSAAVPSLPVPGEEAPRPIAVPDTVPEDERLRLILYFDNVFLKPFDRNKVTLEARSFLDGFLGPEDRALVATFERRLIIRQPFTADRATLDNALLGLEKLSGFAVQAEQERRQVIQQIEATQLLEDAEPLVEAYARQRYHALQNSVNGLRDLISSLGGLPGRKAVLYVSNGIPMTAGEDLYRLLDLEFGQGEGVGGQLRAMRFNARSQFRELIAHANANRVTFYTLQASGLVGRSSASAASRGSSRGGSQVELDFIEQSNTTEPLQMMAEDTGGQSLFNTNNLKLAFERMATDFNDHYSLGYAPAHSGDGRYHKIKVKVKRKGVKVRHRAGYRDKTLESRLNEGILASLLHGVSTNPLGLRLDVLTPQPREDRYFLVPVEVHIPLAQLAMVPQQGARHARLRVAVSVINSDGDTSVPEQTVVPVTVPDADWETAQRQNFVYEAQLLMRRGTHEVAIGLRDELAGESSFVRRSVSVGR